MNKLNKSALDSYHNVIFVCITKGHYQMALKILEEMKSSNTKIYSKVFCSGFLHDQEFYFCKDSIAQFNESYFIDDFSYITHRLKTWKVRGLIRAIKDKFVAFDPDLIICFNDNGYIYQHTFNFYKGSVNIVLFHEGYGDYSDPTSSLKEKLPYLYIKLMLWPYKYLPVTRSYTGLYDYSFLLEPEIITRPFLIQKFKIPSEFIKVIFYKASVLNYEIEPNSILLTLSGKDWVNNNKLHTYLIYCVTQLKALNKKIYMKVAPNVKACEYDFLTKDDLVLIIDDPSSTSESYCFHPHFDYIITDESSAVINAIYSGVHKEFFFLNSEIQEKGFYRYDRNDLVERLVSKKIIMRTTILEVIQQIKSSHFCFNYLESDDLVNVSDKLLGIINDKPVL